MIKQKDKILGRCCFLSVVLLQLFVDVGAGVLLVTRYYYLIFRLWLGFLGVLYWVLRGF